MKINFLNHSNTRTLEHSNIRTFEHSNISHKGFTLVEMLVVIAMIMVIVGAMTASTAKARQRARIAKATQETREITNAILAYEQYAPDHTLKKEVTGSSWAPCTKSSMSIILGGEKAASGEKIPVLYNASIGTKDRLLDPWGNVYQYMIDKNENLIENEKIDPMKTAAALPNYNRLTDNERRGQ